MTLWSNIPSNKPMKMTSLLVSGYVLLSGGAFAGARVGVADIKITFASTPLAPVADLPKEALYPPGFDSVEHGALTNIVAGRISALDVAWTDPKFFKTEKQTQNFLRQLLSITNSQTYAFHIWSYGDGVPSVVATVEHTEGKQGKWWVWFSPSLTCAYLDGGGKWWWGMWPKSVPTPFVANMDAIPWGGVAGSLQMASAVDQANGVIHCWVRNGETNEVSYNDFDFGYWDFVGLEIRQGTNWVNIPRTAPGIACGGCHAAGKIKGLKPKQVITGTNWLRYEPKPEGAGVTLSADRWGWKSRPPASFFNDDTFALDLTRFRLPPNSEPGRFLEARVRQTLHPVSADAKEVTLYSPVFTLDGSTIQFLDSKSHD